MQGRDPAAEFAGGADPGRVAALPHGSAPAIVDRAEPIVIERALLFNGCRSGFPVMDY